MAIISTSRASYQRHINVLGQKPKKPKPIANHAMHETIQAIKSDASLVLQATTENVYQLRLSRLRSRLKQL